MIRGEGCEGDEMRGEGIKLAQRRDPAGVDTLLVVSADLRRAVAVPDIATSLQAARADWARLGPRLQTVAQALALPRVATINGVRVSAFEPEPGGWVVEPLPAPHDVGDDAATG